MNSTDRQQRLERVYRDWKHLTTFGDTDGFASPLLLKITEAYATATTRILIYGQETFGWSWNTEELRRFSYPQSEWTFSDQSTFFDFLRNSDSVEALVCGYEWFSFSAHQPVNRRSPFWVAFRQMQGVPDSGVMWSNLVRADYQEGSVLLAPEPQRKAFLEAQADLLRGELATMEPNACVFFTGPTYDFILDQVFAGIQFQQVGTEPLNKIALLSHPDLPILSYRTYHPGYLRRSRQWRFVEEISRRLAS